MGFTATDGTVFEDRSAYRKYEFKTQYTFSGKTGETLQRGPGQIDGQPFNLDTLTDCEVHLCDHSDQLQIDELKGCKLFIGPSCESVFVRNCEDCVITIACKQLRTRDCKNCTFFLYTQSDPVIETSSGMVFAPFNGAYPGLDAHFARANLIADNNHWSAVFDFNAPGDVQGPGQHWDFMPEEQWRAEGDWVLHPPGAAPGAAPVNPVPKDATARFDEDGNELTDAAKAENSNKMKSFSIHTSAAEAAEQMPFTAEEEAQRRELGMTEAQFRKALADAPRADGSGGSGGSGDGSGGSGGGGGGGGGGGAPKVKALSALVGAPKAEAAPVPFPEGTAVEARYGGKEKWYAGKVATWAFSFFYLLTTTPPLVSPRTSLLVCQRYAGKVAKVHANGEVNILYDDGDKENFVHVSRVRALGGGPPGGGVVAAPAPPAGPAVVAPSTQLPPVQMPPPPSAAAAGEEGAGSGAGDPSIVIAGMTWRLRWLAQHRLLYIFYEYPASAPGCDVGAQSLAAARVAAAAMPHLSTADRMGRLSLWWDDAALAAGEGKLRQVEGLRLAGLVNIAEEHVRSVAEHVEDGIAHPEVSDPQAFVDVQEYPVVDDYQDLTGKAVPELDAHHAAHVVKAGQLALMLDAFAMQHGIITEEETG